MNIARIIEFIGNHYVLCGLFLAILVLFVVNEINRGGRSITSVQLTSLVNQDQGIVVDIRPSKDFGAGHITDSLNIPLEKFTTRMVELNKYKEKIIILVDAAGQQSKTVNRDLKKHGFHVVNLSGGISSWQTDGLPLVKKKA